MMSFKPYFLFLFIALPMVSCESFEEVYPYDVYTIKKGKHYSTKKLSSLQTDGIHFIARFDASAIYECETNENQYDINKLMGFSDHNSHHQDNSARFGWCWSDEQLNIHSYVYANGERITQYLGSVPLHQDIEFQILMTDDSYIFSVNGSEASIIDRQVKSSKGIAYMLYPYFGGDEVAPHDINIKIRMLW